MDGWRLTTTLGKSQTCRVRVKLAQARVSTDNTDITSRVVWIKRISHMSQWFSLFWIQSQKDQWVYGKIEHLKRTEGVNFFDVFRSSQYQIASRGRIILFLRAGTGGNYMYQKRSCTAKLEKKSSTKYIMNNNNNVHIVHFLLFYFFPQFLAGNSRFVNWVTW